MLLYLADTRTHEGAEGPQGGVSSIYDLDDGYRVDDLEDCLYRRGKATRIVQLHYLGCPR